MKAPSVIISLGILVIIALLIFRVCTVSEREQDKMKLKSEGTYKLDVESSQLGVYSKEPFVNDFYLFMSSDKTFHFSRDADFIYDSLGTWETEEDGPYSFNRLRYKKNKKISNQIDYCCYDSNKVDIELPFSKKGSEQVELLVFKKIK